MKITKTLTKVLIIGATGTGVINAIEQTANVLAHPRNDQLILISDKTSNQLDSLAHTLPWANLTDYKDDPFNPADRDEMINILANRYFNTDAKVDSSRFLDNVGDGSGDKTWNGDYLLSSAKALIKPDGRMLMVERLMIFIEDSGGVDAGSYGNAITLVNGISIKHEKQTGELIRDVTDQMPIMTNGDYAKFGFQISDISFGQGLNYVHAVLTFSKNGTAIQLQPDEQLAVHLNDNFTDLVGHTFKVGAYYME